MRRANAVWSYFLATGLLAGVFACGGSSSGPTDTPTPQPTPTPCTQTNVYQDAGGISASSVVYDDFSVPDTGRLDVTLDWTLSSSQVGFYLVPANTCTTVTEFNNRTCNFLVRSEPGGAKPKKISTANFAAGNYRWLIANYASVDESVSFQIVLSKGSCAALSGVAPGASGQAAEDLPALGHMLHR
jgi:hypothetical protein